MKCALSNWLVSVQTPCLHNAFDGNRTSLQHRMTFLNRLCTVLSCKIHMHNSIFCQQVGCLYSWPPHGFNCHPLTPVICLTFSVHAIGSKLHFMHFTCNGYAIVRSWIVHKTPIPCSLFHFCPNLPMLPHYLYVANGLAWLLYGRIRVFVHSSHLQLKSLFSFTWGVISLKIKKVT